MSANARSTSHPLLGALAIAVAALVFLWEPITRFGDSTFTTCDFLQDYDLTRVEDGVTPRNALISDVSVEYHPWYLFDREEVMRGKLPTWNRWNGCGVPHLANFQSAVFSPLTLPYYLFSFKAAALWTAFLKLFGLGYFTFLFLRELRVSFLACCFGGVVYMFAGHNVLRLGYSQSAVAMLVPAGLWALERMARAFERTAREEARGTPGMRLQFPGETTVFVAVLAGTLLFGHPETYYFALLTLVIYAVGRTFALWRDHRGIAGSTRRLAWLGVQLVVSGVLAAGICAVALLPFFEYLSQSFIFGDRTGGGQTPLPIEAWPCHLFPDLLGNPSKSYNVDHQLPRPDFDTVTMAYVGGIALFLAAAAPFWVRGRRVVAFAAALAVVWVFYAHGLWGTQPIFEWVPTLKMVPINRSQVLVHVCIAVCAAFALDRLADPRRGRDVGRALATALAGLALLFLFRAGAAGLAAATWNELPVDSMRDLIPAGSAVHVERMSALFVGGVACASLAWVARAAWARAALATTIVLLAFAGTGGLFRGYNPAIPDTLVYPRSPLLAQLVEKVGDRRAIVMGTQAIPPHANMRYEVPTIAVWDGINIRRLEVLRRRLFSPGGNWQIVTYGSTRGLELFGFNCVLDSDRWVDFDTVFGFVEDRPGEAYDSAPIVPGHEIEIDFTGASDGLESVRVSFATGQRALEQTIDLVLVDRDSGERIASQRLERASFGDDRPATRFTRLQFRPLADAKSRHLRLTISSPDGNASTAWSVRCRRDYGWMANLALWRLDGVMELPDGGYHPDHATWQCRQGGTVLEGFVTLDLHLALHEFKSEGPVGNFELFRYLRAVPRFHTVSRAYVARDEDAAWNAVLRRSFDPAQTVVLEGVEAADQRLPAGAPDANSPVEIVSEDHGALRLRTTRADAGWLVLAQPWYPGWVARVNGVSTPVVRANYAFAAVKLPAGACAIELDFEPLSVRLGLWASLASLLVFVGWALVSRRALRVAA